MNFISVKLPDSPITSADGLTERPGYLDYLLRPLSDVQRHYLLISVIVLLVFTVITNVLAIVVYCRRKIRPLFKTCLYSLTVSDLMTTVFSSTVYISQLNQDLSSVWTLGELMCNVNPFVTTMAIIANSLTLVCIAMDRFLAVGKIRKEYWKPSSVFTVSCIVLIWGLAAGISSPMVTSYYIMDIWIVETDPNNSTSYLDLHEGELCVANKADSSVYFTVVFSIIFVPLVVIFLWLNSVIASEIIKRRSPIQMKEPSISSSVNTHSTGIKKTLSTSEFESIEEAGDKSKDKLVVHPEERVATPHVQLNKTVKINSARKKRHIRMFKAVIILMVVFFVCRLPTWIYLLVKLHITANSNIHWLLHYCFGLLSILNCFLNPFLYTFLAETIKFTVLMSNIMAKCCARSHIVTDEVRSSQIRREGVFIIEKANG